MNLAKLLTERRFAVLLVALCILLTSYPIEESSGQARLVFMALFDLVFLAGLVAMWRSRTWSWLGTALATPALVTIWGGVLFPESLLRTDPTIAAIGSLFMASFLALLVLFILRDLFSSQDVTSDQLCGAVSVYLLLGVTWGYLFNSIEIFSPGSFEIPRQLLTAPLAEQGILQRDGVLFYYSFVTLTTLGYGDISPVAPTAQMAAMWEAIIGQVYLAILVARLVGMHLRGAGNGIPESSPNTE